ncbi:MAG: FtsX-like permease family protein, partial [Fulvivirga sp.]|nr:FtsX-like permease family protein [Fulvivirga sp.]
DRENVLTINNASQLGDDKQVYKHILLDHPGVDNVSYSKRLPAGRSMWMYTLQSHEMDKGKTFQTFIGDENFLPVMGFELLEGRNFSQDIASDSSAIILNESAVKEMLLKEPVGAKLKDGRTVIGVVADFSYETIREAPGPVVLIYDAEGYRLSVKIKEGASQAVLDYAQKEWQKLDLEEPMAYSFLDQSFEKLMEKEKTLGKTIAFFTIFAILISCLGLFGLAAFMAQQKQKEIGIRKIFGAGITDIILLLNKSFTRQVMVALIIAIPVAWYFVDLWLRNFSYRINLQFGLFILGGALALIIAWLTVSYLSFRAANADPVDSLRNE